RRTPCAHRPVRQGQLARHSRGRHEAADVASWTREAQGADRVRRSSWRGLGSDGMTNSKTEEFQFSGDTLLAKIKEILREGNVRRLVIKNEEGRVLIDVPLSVGVVGTLLAPQLAAIGAIAALVIRG